HAQAQWPCYTNLIQALPACLASPTASPLRYADHGSARRHDRPHHEHSNEAVGYCDGDDLSCEEDPCWRVEPSGGFKTLIRPIVFLLEMTCVRPPAYSCHQVMY